MYSLSCLKLNARIYKLPEEKNTAVYTSHETKTTLFYTCYVWFVLVLSVLYITLVGLFETEDNRLGTPKPPVSSLSIIWQ